MTAPVSQLSYAEDGNVFARASAELATLHQRRERLLGDHITDQQWAILLQLVVAEESGEQLPTAALGRVAGAPKSTLLRLINDLCNRGLIERDRSSPDRRVTLVRPTSAAGALIVQVFKSAA